jgi:transcriptional regulator with XRE-family HTH domain
MDRYFSSRVRRLYREKGWSMAAFARRTTIGRSILQRIIDTRGYCHGITTRQTELLALAFGVTGDYLRNGIGPEVTHVTRPSEWQTQLDNSRLRAENDRLRRRRDRTEIQPTSLLSFADNEKLEVRRRDGKVILVQDGEYEIAEADTLKAALGIALNHSISADV